MYRTPRMFALTLLATLLSSAAIFAAEHDAITPVPRDANWMKRHDAMNARVKEGNVDLVFIGDSITQGWELSLIHI